MSVLRALWETWRWQPVGYTENNLGGRDVVERDRLTGHYRKRPFNEVAP